MFAKKGPSTWMLVWLQHEKDCFDNPTFHIIMEGKAAFLQTFCNLLYLAFASVSR